jgi:hypothetical protein
MIDEKITLKPKLKPVIYTTSYYPRGTQNTTQQILLLKAMKLTQDPQELKKMIHVKTVAEVYRTLDKLAMRKEYHEALAKAGISFEFIVDGLKDLAVGSKQDGDKLKALQTLLKSLGMDKYDGDASSSTGSWEEALLKQIESNKELPAPSAEDKDSGPSVYEVVQPEIPESAKRQIEEENETLGSIYDSRDK